VPDPDAPLKESDTLLVAGTDENLRKAAGTVRAKTVASFRLGLPSTLAHAPHDREAPAVHVPPAVRSHRVITVSG